MEVGDRVVDKNFDRFPEENVRFSFQINECEALLLLYLWLLFCLVSPLFLFHSELLRGEGVL